MSIKSVTGKKALIRFYALFYISPYRISFIFMCLWCFINLKILIIIR